MEDKIIKWTGPLLLNNDTVTHYVTSIHVNPITSMVHVHILKGVNIEHCTFSMAEAQEIGFINFNALLKYCK